MEVKVLFDKESIEKEFKTGWGASFLIDDRVLFDTGEHGDWLSFNMQRLKVDVDRIVAVVISHHHWDHTGGLWELLNRKQGLKVYGCPHFDADFKGNVKRFKGELIEVESVTEITENIFTSGEIEGRFKGGYISEQALVVKTGRGITVITGCSHPGIVKIIQRVQENFPREEMSLVFGGFHLMDKQKREIEIIADKLQEMGVQKVGPTHCSGYEAQLILKEKYKHGYIPIKVGKTLRI
ncbi:MAG: MBL fold metallo-hydrolase [bacterium]